jgi:lysophospholipase L1-like esterase
VEKPDNTRRVLMLGDSFTMGKGVQDDETFSVLLEQMLQESLTKCSGGNVEVLNAGVDSYAPILELLYVKRELARLSPDLVILNLDHSDLAQETAYRHQAVRDPQGEVTAVPQVWQQSRYERFLSWATRNLYFTRVALVHVNRAMGHRELSVRQVVNEFGREHFAHTLAGDVDRSAQWRDIFDSIGRIKQLSDSMGAEFLLTTYPWGHQLEGKHVGWVEGRKPYMQEGDHTSDVTQQNIRAHAEAAHIDVLETLPVFQAYEGPGPLYFNMDPHWTPTGQKVMAEALYRGIAERQLPRWCAAR